MVDLFNASADADAFDRSLDDHGLVSYYLAPHPDDVRRMANQRRWRVAAGRSSTLGIRLDPDNYEQDLLLVPEPGSNSGVHAFLFERQEAVQAVPGCLIRPAILQWQGDGSYLPREMGRLKA